MALRPAALVTGAFALALIAVALVTSHGPDPVAEPPPEPAALAASIPEGPDPTPAPGGLCVTRWAGGRATWFHWARLPPVPFSPGQAASPDRRSQRAPQPGQP